MSSPAAGLWPLFSFFRKPPLDADLEAEIAAHIDMAIEDNIAAGLPPMKPAVRRWFASAESTRRKTNIAKREDL